MIGAIANNHADLAWRFANTHQTQIDQQLDSLSKMQFMPGLLDNSNDPAALQTLRTYIDTQVPAPLRRLGNQGYLQLQQRLRIRSEELPKVDAWVRSHH